jgi:hypothetical protein
VRKKAEWELQNPITQKGQKRRRDTTKRRANYDIPNIIYQKGGAPNRMFSKEVRRFKAR